MRGQHLLVGHVVRHLPKPVHVVGEREQARLDLVLGQHAKGMAHHRGARDLAERADMRQAGRAVAGLEQHLVLRAFLQPRDNGLRLLERPGVGLFGERTQIARVRGKIDNGHLRGLRAAENSDFRAECKYVAAPLSWTSSGWAKRSVPTTARRRLDCYGASAPRMPTRAAAKTGSPKNTAATDRCSGLSPRRGTWPSSGPGAARRCPCARRCRCPRRRSGSRRRGRRRRRSNRRNRCR